jgi:hypothetical protein
MSYHVFDNNTPNDLDDDENLYLPIRTTVRGTSSTSRERETWQRQLLPALPDDSGGTDPDSLAEVVNRPPTGDTVVTWCPWHRGMRDFDNVLFYDGSIQILPRTQQLEDNNGTNASCATLAPGDCVAGADRKPTAPK